MLSDILTMGLNGLIWSMSTFIVAAGLTLVFGILHVLNFSHGGFFMIGAYVACSVLQWMGGDHGIVLYLLAALAGGIVVGAAGLIVDFTVFRRLQDQDGTYVLIATYALLLLCGGAVKFIWGLNYQAVDPPRELQDIWIIGDAFIPTFSVFVILSGLAIYLVLEWGLYHTRLGKMLEAIAMDPWMARVMGINVNLVYQGTIVAGFALAGFGGGLLLANQSLSPDLAHIFILQGFGVVIVGGMGSVRGAFIASLLLGALEIFSSMILPDYPGVLFFCAIALTLLFRPQGLMGREVHS